MYQYEIKPLWTLGHTGVANELDTNKYEGRVLEAKAGRHRFGRYDGNAAAPKACKTNV